MRQRDMTKRAQWRAWISEWQASGKTAEVFGRERGVSPSTVYWWRKELARQLPAMRAAHVPSVTFVQMPLKAATRITAEREAIEVVVRGERRVRVSENFLAPTLQAVVRALKAIS